MRRYFGHPVISQFSKVTFKFKTSEMKEVQEWAQRRTDCNSNCVLV